MLIDAMVTRHVDKGCAIVSEGSKGDTFYIVKRGQVNVEKRGKGVLTTLKANSYFGELALLHDAPRNASIVAATDDVELLGVDRKTFNLVLTDKLRYRLEREAKEAKIKEARALAVAKAKQPDVPLDQCESLAVLGKGAFGLVKLVRVQRGPKLSVYALKVLQKQQLVDEQQSQRIVTEKRTLQLLRSPFCLQLVSTMQDQECLYLLTEFLQGGDLYHAMEQADGHLEMVSVEYYAACVAAAFKTIHGKGMVYRDLKPENLMLDGKGLLKVIDFGMVKKCKKKTFTVCGTPDYMVRPEAAGPTGRAGRRSHSSHHTTTALGTGRARAMP